MKKKRKRGWPKGKPRGPRKEQNNNEELALIAVILESGISEQKKRAAINALL